MISPHKFQMILSEGCLLERNTKYLLKKKLARDEQNIEVSFAILVMNHPGTTAQTFSKSTPRQKPHR